MAEDYTNRAVVDNDFDPNNAKNRAEVESRLAALTGLAGLYHTNNVENALACSTLHPNAFVICPEGLVVKSMLVATPDQVVTLDFNRESGTLTLIVDGRTVSTIMLGSTFATKTEMAAADAVLDAKIDEILSASQAMVVAGTINATTGELTSVNTTLFGTDTDWTTIDFSVIPRYINVKAGWTFRVVVAGNVMGYGDDKHYEVGDQIQLTTDISKSDSAYITPSNYTAIQNNVDVATQSALGLVKVPSANGLSVNSGGAVQMAVATNSTKGVVQANTHKGVNINNGNIELSLFIAPITDATEEGVSGRVINIYDNDHETLIDKIFIPFADASGSSPIGGLMSANDKVRLNNAALAYYFTDSAQWSIQSIFADNISAETLYTTLDSIDKEATIYIHDYASNGRMGWVELHRGGQTNDTTTRGTKQSYYAIVTDDDGEAYLYSFDVEHTETPAAYNLYLHKNHERIVLDSDINGELNLTNQMFNYRTTAGSLSVANKAQGDIAKIKALYGNTIVWKQLVHTTSFTNTIKDTENRRTIRVQYQTTSATTGLLHVISNIADNTSYSCIFTAPSDANGQWQTKVDGVALNIPIIKSPNYPYETGGVISDLIISQHHYYTSFHVNTCDATTIGGINIDNIQVFDLSLMFGLDKEPTLAQFEAWLAEYYPRKDYMYNAGTLVNVAPEAIKTVGFNLWDEEWELGDINDTTGEYVASDISFRSKNYIKVSPNTNIYIKYDGSLNSVLFYYQYDANKKLCRFVKSTDYTTRGKSIVTTENTAYIRFRTGGTIPETVYRAGSICINLAWSGKRNGEYEPYWEETTQIDVKTLKGKRTDGTVEVMFPDGLKALDDVHDEIKGNKAIKRIGKFVPTTNTVWARSPYTVDGTEVYRFLHIVNDGLKTNNTKNYAACGKYASTRYIYVLQHTNDKQIALFGSEDGTRSTIGINDDSYTDVDSFKAAIVGTPIYYVLDTPIEYDLDADFEISYKCDDYGTEQILPYDENIPATLPIIADIEYGLNILDTISRLHLDYVSVHKQTLSELEQAQVKANLGIEDHAKVLSVDIQRLVARENTGDDAAYIVLKELQAYRVDTGNIVFARYNNEYGIVTYVNGTEGMGYRFIGDDKYYEWVFDSYDDGDKMAMVIFNEKLDGVNYHVQTLTQAQYDALTTKDPRTVYLITDQQWYEQYTTLAQLITALNTEGIGNIQSISVAGTALSPDSSKNVNIPSSDGNAFGVVKIVLPNDFSIANKEMTVVEGNESDVVTMTAMKRIYDAINTRLKAIEDALTWQAYPQS